MAELSEQVALVTGGGRGIGRGIVLELAKAGASVAINYFRDQAAAEEVAGQVEAGGGRRCCCLATSPIRPRSSAWWPRRSRPSAGSTIAVGNAAYSDRQPFYEADMDGFHRTIDVTMWGSFYLARAAAQQMIAQGGGGSIVLVSSPHAYVPIPRSMAYNMSKAAMDQMARTAAIELVEHRIRVNIMTPGWIDTPGERKFASDETIQSAGKKLPWGRLGDPTKSVAAWLFCAIRAATI